MKNELYLLNKEINKKEIINKIIERCIIFGNYTDSIGVDYLYYGDENYGIFVKCSDLFNYFSTHKNLYLTTPHFGPLTYQPYHRDLGKKGYSKKRMMMQLKWFSLSSDLEKISKK